MFRTALCSTAIVTILSVSAAIADVTPEEVWENWQVMSTSVGQEMTVGDTQRDGDTLVVSNIIITQTDPMGGSASVTFDKLSFTDNGDGTVLVTVPQMIPFAMAFPPDADGNNPASMHLTAMPAGMKIVAGGSPTETSFEITAPATTLVLDEVMDAEGNRVEAWAQVTLTGTKGKHVVRREGEATSLDSAFEFQTISVNIDGPDAAGTGRGKAAVSLTNAKMNMQGNLLSPDVMANMAVALNSGFTMDMGLEFGALSVEVEADGQSGPARLAFGAASGGIDLVLNKERMNYGVSLVTADLSASGPEIPFPQFQMSLGEFGFNILMPVSKSDEPQEFAYLTKFVDLTTSEDIWGLFDPAGSLSRDPVTFVLDLKGTGRWFHDITDPSFDIESVDLPGELDTLDLTLLQAKAAGADVTANGGLTFDNNDTVTYGGAPKPMGKITVNIKGVQALIDNLIAMGILTDDDAMGARMVLAIYARPGAGADELVTELEFKDGGFFANGQQVW